MVRALVPSLTLAVLVLTASPGCGDDGDGGEGGNGAGNQCSLDTQFDCVRACERYEAFCDGGCGEVPEESCDDPECVQACENARREPELIPEQYKPLVLGQLNCIDDNDTCLGFTECLRTCFMQ